VALQLRCAHPQAGGDHSPALPGMKHLLRLRAGLSRSGRGILPGFPQHCVGMLPCPGAELLCMILLLEGLRSRIDQQLVSLDRSADRAFNLAFSRVATCCSD
jgi:hypothetical protein